MSIGHMLTWMCTTGCHYRVHLLKNISILQRFKFSNPLIILSNPGMLLTFQYAILSSKLAFSGSTTNSRVSNQSLPNPTCQLVPYSLVYYIMHQFSPTLSGGQWWSGQPIRPQLHWTQQCLHGKNSSCDCLQEDLLGWGHCQGCSGVCSSRLSFILSWYHNDSFQWFKPSINPNTSLFQHPSLKLLFYYPNSLMQVCPQEYSPRKPTINTIHMQLQQRAVQFKFSSTSGHLYMSWLHSVSKQSVSQQHPSNLCCRGDCAVVFIWLRHYHSLANHRCVCLSFATSSLVCAVISYASVPACRTVFHLYSHSCAVGCSHVTRLI